MILPFSTQLNGKPTYFVEKIWESILSKGILCNAIEMAQIGTKALHKNYIVGTHKPKLHTIREDLKDRWKKGTMIDFFINCRQKDMFRFAPRIPVVSIQEVIVFYKPDSVFFAQTYPADVFIDNRKLEIRELLGFVTNDGFETIEDFFAYFNKDFTGKLIHWTDLKY